MQKSDEFEIINDLSKVFYMGEDDNIIINIGDDASEINFSSGFNKLFSTDIMVENIHYDLAYFTPEDVGYKAVAVNVSDIAAMGGNPKYLLLNFVVPSLKSEYLISGFADGVKKACQTFNTKVIGGDLSSGKENNSTISVTIIGESSSNGAITRKGAEPGDIIAVTGDLGLSYIGLCCFKKYGRKALENSELKKFCIAHLRPEVQFKMGWFLGLKNIANSMIDISDGFLQDLNHILTASEMGAEIDFSNIPFNFKIDSINNLNIDFKKAMLSGGEDFQLLFTFSKSNKEKVQNLAKELNVPINFVGEVKSREYGFKLNKKNLCKSLIGFKHF